MCVIPGLFSKADLSNYEDFSFKMNDSLIHSWLDSGFWFDESQKFSLGDKRLSILYLSKAECFIN
jgi:asparagine synthetase B (glutamine-hydrolysing)